ncbi:MAG: phosphoethanolamine transferase CptA [Treponema sp.]|nr:phosphoethanolamine transferase CptA [Treponema sp.]
MKIHRPLGLSVLVYEVVRMVILLVLSVSLEPSGFVGPALIGYLLAPQILFALIALFVWIDETRYRDYVSLYVAGKTLLVWAGLLWLFSSFKTIVKALMMYTGTAGEPFMIAVLVLIPFEIATIIRMVLYMKRPAEDH